MIHTILKTSLAVLLLVTPYSCSEDKDINKEIQVEEMEEENPIEEDKAEIVSVSVSGNELQYTFSVGILSPDEGCDQYANWWEVVTESGELVYRRILGHSHVNEQPFIRSGGTVKVSSTDVVIVRAHMNTSGFGVKTYQGTVERGFTAFQTNHDFAKDLETIEPLPTNCAF